jgi:hypothetical protein
VGTDNEISSDDTYDYAYDNEGNETAKTNISTGDTWSYGYNNANELVSAVDKTSGGATETAVVYKYDVFGNRIEQDVTPYTSNVAGTTVVQKYALDGWNPALTANARGNDNWNVWADLSSSDTLQTAYLRGDAVDQLFAEVGSSTHWKLTDSQGSVRDVITNSASVVDSISHTAFGTPLESAPGDGGRYMYRVNDAVCDHAALRYWRWPFCFVWRSCQNWRSGASSLRWSARSCRIDSAPFSDQNFSVPFTRWLNCFTADST